MPGPPVVVIVGPTGVGKSDLAVELALLLGGEVVNADAMQIYRGMDIGTAKLPLDQRRGVRHHLIDLLEVSQPATVAQFQRLARAVIADCHARHVPPIVVGGSALYVRAVTDRFVFPGSDAAARARWERELALVGPHELHQRLAARDPAAAAVISAGNGRRIVRALEVIELTGRPYPARLPPYEGFYDQLAVVGLDAAREVVDAKISARVERMWAAGFVAEVRALEAAGLRRGRTASRALGYAQILRFLAGELGEAQARAETVRATRRFARRQQAWFRKDPRISWLPAGSADLPTATVNAVRRQWAS